MSHAETVRRRQLLKELNEAWERVEEQTEAYRRGQKQERERIKANILDTVDDFRICKHDSCQEIANLLESRIEDWTGENEQ